MEVTTSLNQIKVIIFVKIPLITIGQVPVEHAQFILLEACLRHAHKLFGLIQRNAGPAYVSMRCSACVITASLSSGWTIFRPFFSHVFHDLTPAARDCQFCCPLIGRDC